jgi:hypothetical protein
MDRILNLPFFSLKITNVPAAPAYGVYISKLIRYSMVFSPLQRHLKLSATRTSSKIPEELGTHERIVSSSNFL